MKRSTYEDVHTWLINRVERTLEARRLRDGAWTIVAVCSGSDTVRVEPFDAIELGLARLWVDSSPSPDPSQPGPG